MKIYLLNQDTNNGYNSYDSLVVCAENEDEARQITPYAFEFVDGICKGSLWAWRIEDVKVKYLGEAKEGSGKGIILGSFNAG